MILVKGSEASPLIIDPAVLRYSRRLVRKMVGTLRLMSFSRSYR